MGNLKIWFYVGDSFDWLETHAAVSGVIRVTAELFFGALTDQDNRYSKNIVPWVLTHSNLGLAPVSVEETLAYLASKIGRLIPSKGQVAPARPKPTAQDPYTPDDCTLFTGVVWSTVYTELFTRLSADGVSFCVLVYDIIPIERPDLVTDEYRRAFVEWLTTTVAKARIIFVSSRITKDNILRWAALAGVNVVARIAPVTFGSMEPKAFASVQELERDRKTRRVNVSSFVLSVGTIDKRKNQALLCKVWCRLIAELGERCVPQLVLVGRNDLTSRDWDRDIAAAMQSSRIVIIEGASDREVDRSVHLSVAVDLDADIGVHGHGISIAYHRRAPYPQVHIIETDTNAWILAIFLNEAS